MAPSNTKNTPWANKYGPKHLGEVIGNTEQVRKLAEWLRDWDDVVLHGKTKEAPKQEEWKKFNAAPENINARAALISGPPGIGKTTTSVLVARCSPKYTLLEFNASDARSKVIVDQMSQSLAGNHTLKVNGNSKGSALERTVIIMDECDGMAGGDKGGMAALINMIKVTKNPIICICNERGDQGVRNLAQVCLDIKFKRPESIAVAKRVKHVMEGEGKVVDLHAIEAVVEACGHDIRHIINQTQFFGTVSAHGGESQKDTQVMLSPFDACTKMLRSDGKRHKVLPMDKRLDMFYLDAEMMPLMIQENYLRTFDAKRSSSDGDMETVAKAANLIALGDSMSGNWEVMGSAAVLGTIYPAFLAADESFAKPSFPLYLQKKAPMTKALRVVTEMHGKLRSSTSISVKDLSTTSYHDVLYRRLVKPLLVGQVKEAAKMLFAVGLGREFFTEQAITLRTPLMLDDTYKKVEGKFKTHLLQELQSLKDAAAPAPVKRKREDGGSKRKSKGPGDAPDVEMEGDGAADCEGGEDDGKGSKKKKQNTKKSGGGGNAAASLGSWKKKDEKEELRLQEIKDNKDPLLIIRYLDGHTCAVRRQVHLQDILDPWTLF